MTLMVVSAGEPRARHAEGAAAAAAAGGARAAKGASRPAPAPGDTFEAIAALIAGAQPGLVQLWLAAAPVLMRCSLFHMAAGQGCTRFHASQPSCRMRASRACAKLHAMDVHCAVS